MRRGGRIARAPMPQRTTPLKKGAKSGRNSGGAEGPRTAIERKNPPAGKLAALPKARRDTGPDRATRQAVIDREQSMCAACGKYLPPGSWRSIQHRVARGVGGGSEIWNLVLLCGSATSPGCHLEAERRTSESHDRGYWLRSDEDPRLVPVMLFSPHGSGITAWLTPDGGYSFEPPEVAA